MIATGGPIFTTRSSRSPACRRSKRSCRQLASSRFCCRLAAVKSWISCISARSRAAGRRSARRCPRGSRTKLLARIERHRTTDGGYDADIGEQFGNAYGCFVALGAYQDLGREMPEPLRMVQCLKFLETPDGAWANARGLSVGSTNATAAAVTLLHQLGVPVNQSVADWLLARAHPQGGFLAMPYAPMPDLLSTATTLHALSGLQTRNARGGARALPRFHRHALERRRRLSRPLGGRSSRCGIHFLRPAGARASCALKSSMPQHIVLYDDECPMCIFQMKVLSWLDWFGVLALVPLSDPRAQEIAPQLDARGFAGGDPLRDAGRARSIAARGRFVLSECGCRCSCRWRLFLWIPGVILIAEIVYQWVSRQSAAAQPRLRLQGCVRDPAGAEAGAGQSWPR